MFIKGVLQKVHKLLLQKPKHGHLEVVLLMARLS